MSFVRVTKARIRRLLPKTLFSRTLLIVVLPMLIVQGVSAYIFYARHWDNVRKHMAISLANDIGYVVHRVDTEDLPPYQLAETARRFNLLAVLRPDLPMSTVLHRDFPYLSRHLQSVIDHPFDVQRSGSDDISILIQTRKGTLWVESSRKRIASSTTYIYMLWMLGTSVLFLLIAILFLRNQVRPIQQLANAAESFGKGQDLGEFRVRGAQEVRRASQAFLVMRERIRRQIEKRTHMLAAISHDLRTPLTRMKLQLAMQPADVQAGMARDIEEMEELIREYLDFVRGEGEEKATPTDISAMLEDIVAGYENRDHHIMLTHNDTLPSLSLRPLAFRRCIVNLLENAFRYGDTVQLRTKYRDNAVTILIDDNGPGIPEAERGSVFQAFRTLDASRGRKGGDGVGLGLSIAKDIVLSHGGTIKLDDAPGGGLRVIIRLPV